MLARWSTPFCSGDGRQAGLLYLAAGYRDTTDHPAIALCQGRRHACIPSGLIAGLSQPFQKNEVTLLVHRDEAKATGKRFVLGHRDGFAGRFAAVRAVLWLR